jgi:hypothetical protein
MKTSGRCLRHYIGILLKKLRTTTISLMIFGRGTSRLRSRTTNHSTTTFGKRKREQEEVLDDGKKGSKTDKGE